jgi:monoamine oxidase
VVALRRAGGGRRLKAVVVGAGFAGLAAAHALTDAGAEVVVFEARDRVGGRVWSHALDDGSVVELGAEFILPGHDTVRRYADELGLRLYEKGTTYGNREPRGGQPVTREQVVAAVERVAAQASAPETLPAALARLRVEPAVAEAILARIEVTTAYPATEQPATVLADSGTAFGDFATHGIAGGNQRLADALARRVNVRLSMPVRRIAWSDQWVEVGGTRFDACVVAVPANVQLAFGPALSRPSVRYGRTSKLFLPLSKPAPPSATLSVPGRFWTYTQLAPDGAPLPVACTFGRPAHDWPAAVRELRPDLEYADAEPTRSDWDAAYSVEAVDTGAPVGPIVFAGEHTAGDWHALMEGALRSGERAAAEVAQATALRTAR